MTEPMEGRKRLRLRARLTLAFGLGAFLLSTLLSAVTYGVVRENLLRDREQQAVAVSLRNATQAERRITAETSEEAVRALLNDLGTIAESTPVLRLATVWVSANPVVFEAPGDIDPALLQLVGDGAAARMQYRIENDQPFLVVGVPLTTVDAVYFEATPLDDIQDTLASLALALIAAGAVTTLAGIGLGAWASRRVLRPIEEVSETAQAIASGDLTARLEVEQDPDLASLAASFNEMAANLEGRIERDAQFASNVSHELRSPLMTIIASTEILDSRRHELSERSQTALDLLGSDLQRFRQLVEDLLEISRYDVGAQALELDYFGVVEFVTKVAADVQKEPIPVSYDEGMETAIIEADKRRLARVITNLIQNANNYAGGATAIEIHRRDLGVDIYVLDEGPGVPEAERQAIFGRFARGSEGGRRGAGTGTGLGLALAAEHIRLHGGTVTVTDRPDGRPGACFVVELPGVVR